MFVDWSSTKHILFVQTAQFDWLPLNLQKNVFFFKSSEATWVIKLKLCRNGHSLNKYVYVVFIAVAYALHFGCYGNLVFP